MESSSSSSSSSSDVVQVKYDVFISFRGKDIRDGFLSHLKKGLKQKQIDAYVDDRLEGGDEISPVLLKAIEQSLISLIIFSKGYASSKWCLDELVKIIECMDRNRQIVIPVFYNVDPSHVRYQKSTYGEALAKHQKKYKTSKVKVQNWITALEKVADLSGFHSSFGDEAELIEEIVNCVCMRLNHMYQSDIRGLVGIDERIADIESFMNLGSKDVRVIGIWGMGGIGKTTLAAVVFNRLCFEYEGCYFMANVREELEKCGMVYLKNKILSVLLNENDLHIGTPNGVPPYVKRRLSRKKVLIVLDDVNDSEELEDLVGEHDWYGLGSRIIVTTRDRQVLGQVVDIIYKAKPLNSDEAVRLFYLNAFKQTCFDMEWIKLSKKVISYATGNPLALKVLGKFLYNKTKEEWESQLEKLKKMPYAKIQASLRLSYDGLDREEKNIFLYIACFFKRTVEKDRIKYLLDACGYSTTIGLKDLQDKTLISEVRNGACQTPYISMHDLIQEMGWEIVREECMEDPGKRSRLCDPNDIYPVLKNNSGTKAIQSITLNVSNIEELSLDPQVFASMQELKFLSFSKPYAQEKIFCLPRGLENFPNKLILFHWDSYPLKSLPSTFCAENLVELKMQSSRMERLWDGVVSLVKLKKVDLSYCKELVELPDFSMASNLEEVELYSCRNLRCVHPSILSIHKLARLNLSYCKGLTSLKSSIHLSSLRYLSLSYCSRLKEFSVVSENMKNLSLASTAIIELPSSIGSLNRLESLILDGCKSLKSLPSKLANMKSLRSLRIHGCIQLDASNLHNLLDGLWCLQELLLEECCNLFGLPETISTLSSLRLLLLKETDILSLPASIKQLTKLEKLDLSGCRRLRSLPELPSSIKELYAYNCTSLETVEFTSEIAELLRENKIRIRFQNCVNLSLYSLKAVGAHAHVLLKKMAYQHLLTIEEGKMLDCPLDVIYPGGKVPEWFVHRTTQASITIDLPSVPTSEILGFIFCVVVGRFPSNDKNFIGCDCYLESKETKRGQMSLWSSIHAYEFISDHVCLWFDDRCCIQAHEANDERTAYNPKLVFEFFAQTDNTSDRRADIAIQECAVCPVYASVYHNFVKELELKLMLQGRAIGMGVGNSNGKKEEEGTFLQTMEFKQLIFPNLSTSNWKNGTQGLKDIIYYDCLKGS